jgi:periplasmic divalent cation tolerance protein
MDLIAVYTSLPSRQQAQQLAASLVQSGLVACAQISEIESFYRWDGELQQEIEYRLLLKAAAHCYDAIEAAILSGHSYDLPAIHAIRIERAHAPYAAWIQHCCELCNRQS